VRIAAAAALVLLLAGCGSRRRAEPPLPSLATVCGTAPAGLDATPAWLETSDRVRLYSVSAGKGDTAVVLAHESGGAGLCGWLPTMRYLTAHGFRVLALDFRGTSPSVLPPPKRQFDWREDLQAAVDAAGAKRVILMGASFGGAAAVAYAPHLHGVDGVVSVSGELALPTTEIDAIGNAPRLRVPLLVIASRLDGYLDTEEARRLVRAAGSRDKEVVLFPGKLHGWDILDERPRARRVLLAWLTRRQR
jgi:alpha-beta hydrolase superfamily lysophospholipase